MKVRSTSIYENCFLLLLIGCPRHRPVVPVLVGVCVVQAKLQAALILPHGDAAFDPDSIPAWDVAGRRAAHRIARAARAAAAWFAAERQQQQQQRQQQQRQHNNIVDVVFLVSPHGVALSNDFGVLFNAAAGGQVEIGADNHNPNGPTYTVTLPSVPLAPALSQQLVETLTTTTTTTTTSSGQPAQNVTGIQFPENPATVPMVLSWAEVIPLLLLGTAARNNSQQQHLIWTQPLRRFDHAAAMIPELLQLGQALGDWMEADEQQRHVNFGVLVSGDLSHTHRADGPYGYSETAARMDRALGAWASGGGASSGNGDPCSVQAERALLETAAALQDRALSCGFTGFVLLHGMLCRQQSNSNNNRQQQQQWKSDVLVNRNATYFGMMVANFSRTSSRPDDATLVQE